MKELFRSQDDNFAHSSRRHFLARNAFGLSSAALAYLLGKDNLLAAATSPASSSAAPVKPILEPTAFDLLPKQPHHPAQARSVISLFMGGGPSHLDLFDPKPLLDKYAGQQFPGSDIKYDNAGGATSIVLPSPFQFTRHGQSGIAASSLVPHFGEIADEVTLVRSMTLPNIRNHVAGMRALTTGRGPEGYPSLGSWVTYGLGSESQELPAYVALIVGGNPPGSPFWDSRHLPSIYQGTTVREQEPRIMNLRPAGHLRGPAQERQLSLLDSLNRAHLQQHPGEHDLAARIASYELAAKMQIAASEALDLSKESPATRALYGLDDDTTKRFGEACLLARRLVERGVRFVQIWYYSWDMHENIFASLESRCAGVDRPSAALVKDLKGRGLLDSTLVQWGGEMGRLPVVQSRGAARKPGRDHNTEGFSVWLAGGGVKAGHVHGATDEFGHRAQEDPVTQHDFHATLLHLMGLDHQQLAFQQNGTPVALVPPGEGQVVKGILKA